MLLVLPSWYPLSLYTYIYLYISSIYLSVSLHLYIFLVYLTLYIITSAQVEFILIQWLQTYTVSYLRRKIGFGDLESTF